jgi:sugar (pentulose or hexulose) kinase
VALAVLDIGKTNAKLILLDAAGATLATRARPVSVRPGPPYPHLDLDGIWGWACAALGELGRDAPIDTIVPVTHGAAAVLLADDEVALPALDYEFAGPDERAAAFLSETDPFEATGAPPLPLGLIVGAQLDWQEQHFPEAFARVTDILPYPQYWTWRLSGAKACEVTSLGSHTHLWRPYEHAFAHLVEARGWRERFPPLRRAWEAIGTLRPEVAAATGLSPDCRVLAGIHDSNASYLPYRLGLTPPFTVVSTGTWVIAMTAGAQAPRLDAEADVVLNVDALGDPVPTSRWMGGREIELLAGADARNLSADPASVAALVRAGTMALPSFVAGSGPFPRRAGRIVGDAGTPAARSALAALYAASMADVMLDRLGSGGPVVLEGSFQRNPAFCGLLAALRPEQPLHVVTDPSGTARGAYLLSRWPAQKEAQLKLPRAATAWRIERLDAYRAAWRAALAPT